MQYERDAGGMATLVLELLSNPKSRCQESASHLGTQSDLI
jgi:hypothetical protein